MRLPVVSFAAALAAALPITTLRGAESAPGGGPVIIGYVFPQDRAIDPGEITADSLTHVNYAFANIRDGRIVEGFARDAENFRALRGVRARHPHLKVLIAVGGWTWSGGFSDVALTAEGREVFVDSAVDFVRRHDLDGVDVDWEYPGLPGLGNRHRPQDKQSFIALMTALRAALDRAGSARGRRYLVSFAAGAFPDYLAHTEMGALAACVDFVNLMAYDFREAEADAEAGHHANLFAHPSDRKGLSADRAVREFLASGVPPGKLVLGVPFYGRAWADVRPRHGGLYQPGKPPRPPFDTRYGSLAAGFIGHGGYVRRWDRRSQAPFLWNGAKRVFISYDDPESLRRKCRYVRERGLAGAMFWEYYADGGGALLRTLAAELRRVRDRVSPRPARSSDSRESGR